MKKLYLLVFVVFCLGSLNAQRNVIINSPSNIAGKLTNFSGSGWGLALKPGQSVKGDVVIGIDSTKTDSTQQLEGCIAVKSDVKGKIALIRRGTCNFSTKVFNAQAKGAIAVICYVRAGETPFSPGTGGETINIPVAIVSYDDAQKMVSEIKKGNTVNVTFSQPVIYEAEFTSVKNVPVKEYLPQFAIMKYGNPDTVTQKSIVLKAEVFNPSNTKVATLTATIDSLQKGQLDTVGLGPAYKPTTAGTYTVVYTHNKNAADTLKETFNVTDYTFAADHGSPVTATYTMDATDFNSVLVTGAGNLYTAGASTDPSTHASFAIRNPNTFPVNDSFHVLLVPYTVELDNTLSSHLDLVKAAVASKTYQITGKEKDSLLFVEWKTPVQLKDSADYLVFVYYDGSESSNAKIPTWLLAGAYRSPYALQQLLYDTDANGKLTFYSGFTGGDKFIIKLHTQGFKVPTGVKDLPAWEENSVKVYPNPVSNGVLSLDFNLKEMNQELNLTIVDIEGRTLKTTKLNNVQKGIQDISIPELSNGHYFVKIVGKDGWRTKVFQVVR